MKNGTVKFRKGLEEQEAFPGLEEKSSGYRRQYWCETRGVWQRRVVCVVCDLREFLVTLTLKIVSRVRCKMGTGGRERGRRLGNPQELQ